jgi:hypothetical protein
MKEAFTRMVAIGTYQADLRLDARGHLVVAWRPRVPLILNDQELSEYYAGLAGHGQQREHCDATWKRRQARAPHITRWQAYRPA